MLLRPATLSQQRDLTSSSALTTTPVTLLTGLSGLTISLRNSGPQRETVIRMGGGPRTFPGGVSKWQWKRMQLKKAKQLLKARLSRERHIYEMRKRAELKAAVSELERPWELLHKAAPTSSALFSVAADDQLKVLADRFQKPGGFDMWSENDGPQLFITPDEGLPTARFFPKGVVHSIRPYGRIDHGNVGDSREVESSDFVGAKSEERTGGKYGHRRRIGSISSDDQKNVSHDGSSKLSISKSSSNGVNRSDRRGDNWRNGVPKMDGDRRRYATDDERGRKSMDSRQGTRGLEDGNRSYKTRRDDSNRSRRGHSSGRARDWNSEDVYDMSLQGDENYGFSGSDQDGRISSRGYKQKTINSYSSE
ncbi:hypothetical protein vseg_010744 [Gypsophila vaccaria]